MTVGGGATRGVLLAMYASTPVIHAVMEARRTEFGQTLVEFDTAFADIRIAAVAECQHRVGHAVKTGRGIAHQPRMKPRGRIRRLAIPIRGGDYK